MNAIDRREGLSLFRNGLHRGVLSWLLVFLGLCDTGTLHGDGPQLESQVLKKVKQATVSMRVRLANGTDVEGSGWFADKPGLVVTNAHVLGMIDPDSRPPQQIDATINSGEATARTLKAKLLGADRLSDLAVLRIEGENLPEPLAIGATGDLVETQEVFIFGFPFGKQLGKSITVGKSSVSSLRKENGELKEIQVNGGIHPGNSGGPVIDGRGRVVGVAVATISGTLISFAIPAERVRSFLDGTIWSLDADFSYIAGDKIKIPMRMELIDPLGRVKKITMEYWTAPNGKARPTSEKKPEPVPGDSAIQTADVTYDGKGAATVEVTIPAALPSDNKVYWFRPVYVNGAQQTRWWKALGGLRPNPVERRETVLKFQPKAGKSPPMKLTNQGSFKVRRSGGKEDSISLLLEVIMHPDVGEPVGGSATPVKLLYSSFTIGMKANGAPLRNDEEWRKIGQNMLRTNASVEFDNEGTLVHAQPNLQKVPQDMQGSLTEISEHILQALEVVSVTVPNTTIKPLETFRAQHDLSVGMPGMFVPAKVDLRYQYMGTRKLRDGRPTALFVLSGNVRGQRGAGLNVGGKVSGNADVLLETGQVTSATTNINVDLDVPAEGKLIRLTGTLGVQFRPAPPPKTTKTATATAAPAGGDKGEKAATPVKTAQPGQSASPKKAGAK